MADDKQNVLDLEARRAAAIGAADFAALADCLHDEYFHVFGGGNTCGKADYVEEIKKNPRKPERGELTVRLYGDTAVVTGDIINRINFADKGLRVIHAMVTQVAVRCPDGKWRFVSFQITPKREVV